jgi:hypothetical protein
MVTEFSSMPTAVAEFLQRYAWQPEVKAEEAAKDGVVHLRERLKDADLPKETAEPLFEMLALLALHPYVTSAGTRYLSSGVGEFVLLETFPEEEKAPAEESPLLKALELPRRSALSRLEIEEALLRRGIKVVREQLGLDPQVFRLVLVPPDVYTRVGFQKGWGKQQRWTHVDGYQVVRGGRLRALVAGDVRYGGIFDLCSLGSDDERDRVVARFAVVRRERMAPRI